MPDGTPRKLLDVSKINNLGWKSKINLENGIKMAYEHYVAKQTNIDIKNLKINHAEL